MNYTEKYFSDASKKYDRRAKYLWVKWILGNIAGSITKNSKIKILDLGAGTGMLTFFVAKKKPNSTVIGTDLSKGMLEAANKKNINKRVSFRCMNSENVEFEKNTFDYVISNCSFHHVRNKSKSFKGIFRALKPKGVFVLGDYFEANKKSKKNGLSLGKSSSRFENEFKKSFREFVKETYNKKTKHPREYIIGTEICKNLLKKSGFKKIKLIQSPMEEISIIAARNP
ncbi:MAG: methyltransferase domain-containing protein [archaeon]